MAAVSPPSMIPEYAYIGSRTTRERCARGAGLSVLRVTPPHRLEPVQTLQELINPSYLTLSRDGTRLYAVHGDQHHVSAFRTDRASGRLRMLNQQDTCGENPVHLSLLPDESALVVCNHATGNLALHPVNADGTLQPAVQVITLSGTPGPHRTEQTHAKPHCCLFSPDGRFLFVPDKGLDRIFAFRLQDGRLAPAAVPYTATRAGAGPRHMVFHPTKPLAYVVNELDSTLTSYQYEVQDGILQPVQILPTLPEEFTGDSRAAAIAIDQPGRTLYTSNRGHDSIAAFRLDPETGLPCFLEAVSSGGHTPRSFALSKDGRILYALNEDSDTIVNLAVNEQTGRLTPTTDSFPIGSPVCMIFAAGYG